MITGNKGEWSEIYALFKLLGEKNLYLGDKNIKKLEGAVYPILRILRTENKKEYHYSIEDELVIISGNKELFKIPIKEFKEKASLLLKEIKSKSGTFHIPEIEGFMKSINCLSLKASSTTKTDITIVVYDQRTNQEPTLGFSIKSQLGNPSTLLNAGKTTNFVYKISGGAFTNNEINQINEIDTRSKIIDRINAVKRKGGTLDFVSTEKEIFLNNLVLIDSKLPDLLSHVVLDFYTSNNSKLSDLTSNVSQSNPLNYNDSNGHRFYEYKVKRFLTDIALGMMPSKVWTGNYDATGGNLVIKEDGDILCYHIYNKNQFEDYLFNNTKLETASSKRHGFGLLYEKDGELFMNLNLQIRFLK